MSWRVLRDDEIDDYERRCANWVDGTLEMELIATIRDLQTQRDMYKQQMEYWRAASDQSAVRIMTMRDALRQIAAWAQNDINIRTQRGQWVGSPKFTSLRTAREVVEMVECADKLGGDE